MAKSKKSVSEEKAEKKPIKRGRPSVKKDTKKTSVSDESETFYTRTYKDGTVMKFTVEEYETKILPDIEKSELDILLERVYDNDKPNNVTDFPVSDMKTQTKTFIDLYKIDISRLPQSIVDLINDLLVDFNVFISNTRNVSLIPTIMEKDLKAQSALKEWVEQRKSLIEKLVPLVVIPEKKEPIILPPVTHSTTNAGQQGNVTINQNPLNIRVPVSTYSHTAVTQQPSPFLTPVTDNKDIHNQVMMENMKRNDIKNLETKNGILPPKIEILDKEKYLNDYSESIYNLIKSSWQLARWGYITVSVIQKLLQGADKKFNYEIVENGEESYIVITDGTYKYESPSFTIK